MWYLKAWDVHNLLSWVPIADPKTRLMCKWLIKAVPTREGSKEIREAGQERERSQEKCNFRWIWWTVTSAWSTGHCEEEVPLRIYPPFPSWVQQSRPGIQGCSEHKTWGGQRCDPTVFSSILKKKRNLSIWIIILRPRKKMLRWIMHS